MPLPQPSGGSTPWSALSGHLEGFLADESDPVVGSWAIGQGPDSPDRLLFRHFLGLLLEQPSARLALLEVGCGAGIELKGLVAAGLLDHLDYRGLDLTPECVNICRTQYPSLQFSVGDVYCLSTEHASDVVLCRHVLEHLEDGNTALARLWDASKSFTVVSWFRRPTWNTNETHIEWETVDVEGQPVQFLHQRYDFRNMATYVRDVLQPQGFYRFDFDHHTHPCSFWLLSKAPLSGAHLKALHDFTISERFTSAVESPPPGSSDGELIRELRQWNRQLEAARDWWRERAESLESVSSAPFPDRDGSAPLT